MASADGPSPSAGRMKVMCFISEHRDLDMHRRGDNSPPQRRSTAATFAVRSARL
jgi:hypothetical protein